MYNAWSIKHLLHLWGVITIVAIASIAALAIYSNEFFATSQQKLTQHILPIENASRQMSGIVSSFIARQEKIIASMTIGKLSGIAPRARLEKSFDDNWQQIASVVDGAESTLIIDSLFDYYQQFLIADSRLLELVKHHHTMHGEVSKQIANVAKLEQDIANHVDNISGHINLQVSKNKRKRKLLKQNSTEVVTEIEDEGRQDAIQKLSHNLRVNALKVTSVTQKIIQANNSDSLVSIRGNDIKQYQSALELGISQLKQKLQNQPDLLATTELLERDIATLFAIVMEGPFSIYKLRQQQITNDKILVANQQQSIAILTVVMAKLEHLSILVNDQSITTVNQATQIAESSRWSIIILSVLITLGMVFFVGSISRWINNSLAEVRSAMHALSSEKFDTRLSVKAGNSEFTLLANDFNRFADNNQLLLGYLADAKDAIQAREEHISTILSGVPEAILTLTSEGVIESSNPAAEKVLKVSSKALIGLNLLRFFTKDKNVTTLADIQQHLEHSQEFEGVDYNNQSFSMWLSLNVISGSGSGSGLEKDLFVCVISDITAWKQAERNLTQASSELDTILENAMVGIAFIKDRMIVRVNNKFEELFLCEREIIEGQSARVLYPSDEIYEQLGEEGYGVLAQGGNYVGEIQLARQDGSTFWGMMSGKAIDPGNPKAGTIWLFEDITQQREKDEKLLRLASLDSLTGLPNRAVFNDRLEHAIRQSSRKSTRLAVFFLDLDHFKQINDSLGHKAGDILLCEVANRLKACVREGDTVARLGGDEFTLILEGIGSVQYVAKVAEKVLASVSQLYNIENTEVTASPSIGISLFPADGQDVSVLIRNADAAMYHAKKSGRNNFQFYSSEMNAEAAERLAMQTSLSRAVEQGELYLDFQPQVDLRTGKVLGAEALLRWDSPDWGLVSPVKFIPILEDTGLISQVGEFVLKKACETYLELQDSLPLDFQIAVNLSGRQFSGGQLVPFIRNLLEETGISASNLELEITENVLMDDTQLAITALNELSGLGISLAIDDFGTGYSSLSYLKQFPLDVLKIDRSFVRDVNDDEDDAAIVDAILAMSRRLNLEVVAEGVETREQLKFLQKHDCPRVQGYYFSKPLGFDDFKAFVEKDSMEIELAPKTLSEEAGTSFNALSNPNHKKEK